MSAPACTPCPRHQYVYHRRAPSLVTTSIFRQRAPADMLKFCTIHVHETVAKNLSEISSTILLLFGVEVPGPYNIRQQLQAVMCRSRTIIIIPTAPALKLWCLLYRPGTSLPWGVLAIISVRREVTICFSHKFNIHASRSNSINLLLWLC
jgi:hypothetical protein